MVRDTQKGKGLRDKREQEERERRERERKENATEQGDWSNMQYTMCLYNITTHTVVSTLCAYIILLHIQ